MNSSCIYELSNTQMTKSNFKKLHRTSIISIKVFANQRKKYCLGMHICNKRQKEKEVIHLKIRLLITFERKRWLGLDCTAPIVLFLVLIEDRFTLVLCFIMYMLHTAFLMNYIKIIKVQLCSKRRK